METKTMTFPGMTPPLCCRTRRT